MSSTMENGAGYFQTFLQTGHDGRTERAPLSSVNALHEIFERQVDATPEAVAAIFGRERSTYGDLDRRANRLARHLRRRGVVSGSVVAMLLPRSIDSYAGILGILKSGAAYVPIDPEYPEDRIAFILENSCAAAIVTTEELAKRCGNFAGAIIRMDADGSAIAAESFERLSPDEVAIGPRDLCYVIYTSGTTGRPKGVMIEHRNACHLVLAESQIYGVHRRDRVYQGASLAFDLSVEEIWLAFCAGATLIAATPEMARAGADLARHLTAAGVTVFSTVPTLLSMLTEDLPTVRLLISGAEAFPDGLVERWARHGRRILNTYGPTETTVIATYAEVRPGKPVTIGRAVPGYQVHLLDDELRRVGRGEVGEICIGGEGVARGYVGLSEETGARFLPDPFAPDGDSEARIYRTGDLGRLNSDGDIEFAGRADTQVKLRGFRVELSEIEAVLLQENSVRAAACAVREDVPGVQQLVAYVVPREGGNQPSEEQLRAQLKKRLPAYMVPALIESIADLPRLPSGKLDRQSLPAPQRRESSSNEIQGRKPRSDAEKCVFKVWSNLFHPQSISLEDDFFLDLGGHSLLAARMVSALRKYPHLAHVSVGDVYEHPTIHKLAAALEGRVLQSKARKAEESKAGQEKIRGNEERRHFIAGLVQAFGLYIALGLRAALWVTPYLVYFALLHSGHVALDAAVWAIGSEAAVFPLAILFTVAAKWVLLGRIRPGRYPLWGGYYLRWWLVQALVRALPLDYLSRTPLLPVVYRLLGARIGKDVFLATDRFAAFDLITIGEGTSVDDEASLTGFSVEDGELVVDRVEVGRGCFVGIRSVVSEGAVMEDGARLEDLSLLERDARIPRNETWRGSPARQIDYERAANPPAPARGLVQRAATALLYAILVPAIPLFLLCAFVPGVIFLARFDPVTQPLLYLAAAPLVGASFVLLLTTEVVFLKWLVVGRVREGTYPLHGSFYVRNWLVDQLLQLSLVYVGQLHATLYLAPWYRALGAKLGRFVELSTASATTPDLLEICDEGTIADEVSLGSARVEGGWMTVARTRLGRRAFIGNSGVVPMGTILGDGSLVGVLSISPSPPEDAGRPGASWLGSPPILLPRRQPSAGYSEQRTFRPPRKLRLARAAFELLRITMPPAGFIIVTAALVRMALEAWARIGLLPALLLLPVIYGICCGIVLAGVALIKWAVIGRYRPFVRPLWSSFVWRLEFVNALYEFMATPLVLEALQGTPFLPWYLRVLGARIGRRTYLHTTGFLEWDLTEIGDRAVLNDDCVVQTHLFEDRVLKGSTVRVGADCTVGTCSVVLYDSEMEAGAKLDSLSLLMKGERLPAGTAWAGLPARRCFDEQQELKTVA